MNERDGIYYDCMIKNTTNNKYFIRLENAIGLSAVKDDPKKTEVILYKGSYYYDTNVVIETSYLDNLNISYFFELWKGTYVNTKLITSIEDNSSPYIEEKNKYLSIVQGDACRFKIDRNDVDRLLEFMKELGI